MAYAADNERNPFNMAELLAGVLFQKAPAMQGSSPGTPSINSGPTLPDVTSYGRSGAMRDGAILSTPGPYRPPSTPSPSSTDPQVARLQSIADGLDPDRMAAEEYAAQFTLLNQLAQQAQDRYATANKDVGGMYESLAKSIEQRDPVIAQQYQGTGGAIQNAYNQATQQVSGQYGQSVNQIAELLGRLGIQQAAPTVLSETQSELTKALGDIAGRSQGAQNLNTTLGQNERDYNTRNISTARMAGANQQSDLMRQLQEVLSGYGNKKLELQGQQSATANKYRMSIADMRRQEKEDAFEREDALWNRGYKTQQLDLDRDARLGGLEIDKARLLQQASEAETRNSRLNNDPRDVMSTINNKAFQMYSGNAQAASEASRTLLDIYAESNPQTLNDLFNAIDESPVATDALQRQRLKELGATMFMGMSSR